MPVNPTLSFLLEWLPLAFEFYQNTLLSKIYLSLKIEKWGGVSYEVTEKLHKAHKYHIVKIISIAN